MAYFPLIVVFASRYDKRSGIGTVMALMLPFFIALLIVWTLFFLAWYLLGIPGVSAPEELDVTTDWYVSTGHLPSPGQVQGAVDEAYQTYRSEASGETSQTYPALARVPGHLFGICVAGTSGSMYRAGDSGHEFTIMSVAKPFVFALVCEALGAERVRQKLGVNATGLAFDSLPFAERSADGRSNPMVNAGAIAATSLVPGETGDDKWKFLAGGLSRFAGQGRPGRVLPAP